MNWCEWNDDASETGIYTCKNCTQRSIRLAPSQRTANVRRVCENPPPMIEGLRESEAKAIFGDDDPTLWGNKIKALTDALGIPPCSGCSQRQEWINRAHALVRKGLTGLLGRGLQDLPEAQKEDLA